MGKRLEKIDKLLEIYIWDKFFNIILKYTNITMLLIVIIAAIFYCISLKVGIK